MGGEETSRIGREPLPESLYSLLHELVCLVRVEVSDGRGVDYVVAALHTSASLLHGSSLHLPYDWPYDASLNSVQQLAIACRKKAEADHGVDEADAALRRSFYSGGLFAVLANILLYQVAPDWLACLATAAQHAYFDQFFLLARPIDSLLALVPALNSRTSDPDSDDDFRTTSSQSERLLVLRFVKRSGFKDVAMAFGDSSQITMDSSAELAGENEASSTRHADNMQLAREVAQLIASVPDRAGPNSPEELHSPLYFKLATLELLTAAAERWGEVCEGSKLADEDPVLSFITETISRFCRRGHADVVASQMIAALIDLAEEPLATSTASTGVREKAATFWPSFAMSFKDSHALERWAEALLREMDVQKITDAQAHTIFWNLFGARSQPVLRSIFLEKFLLWKVFPVRCLKWFLNFAVLRIWQAPGKQGASENIDVETEAVKRIAETWSQKQFIQSVQLSQQAYITAALGICLQAMKKEQINGTNNLVSCILQGVTNRLESPISQVRDMAARVALAFSLAIDPEKPLWIDDSDRQEDLLDWDSLLPAARKENKKGKLVTSTAVVNVPIKDSSATHKQTVKEERKRREERKGVMDSQEDDPDAVMNYAEDGLLDWQDEDNAGSVDSDAESESSLQPYDMSDDDADLERGKYPVQLSECALSLRKGDDPDAVENALQVVNMLVRAEPDELDAISSNLAHALVHVRCSSIAVEGEEESAELKRHNALVSLLVCSPLKTVEVLTKELYSAQVDISQRLLILEVMADAARELASSPASNVSQDQGGALVVQLASDPLAWYGPGSDKGPSGSGPWMDVSHRAAGNSLVSWGPVYERVLASRPGDIKLGKSRRWGHRSGQLREERLKSNSTAAQRPKFRFADLAALFMLPVMRLHDQKSHGVDFVNRDFIVLARLLYMLGVCMEGIALQPEAPILGTHLLDLLRSRAISNHPEAFVRRSSLYAASRVLVALHPSQIVTSLRGGDSALADSLEWIREWALQISDVDPDTECATMALACLQLHSEMALQASRQLDSDSSLSSDFRLTDPRRPLVMSL